jgi:hypothetical protein
MKAFSHCIARVLVLCILGAGMPLPASAGIVTTDQIAAGTERDRVKSFLDRADVQAQFQSYGVDPQAARARVDALTDSEIDKLASQIDKLPAGGADVLGVLLIVFIVLLITDILGFTKIFPFTKPMK